MRRRPISPSFYLYFQKGVDRYFGLSNAAVSLRWPPLGGGAGGILSSNDWDSSDVSLKLDVDLQPEMMDRKSVPV